MENLLDSPLENAPDTAMDIVGWWEKRRLPFNMVVVGTGLVGFLVLGVKIREPMAFVTGCIFYLFMANAAYTAGWVSELLLHHYSRGRWSIARHRQLLYGLGMLGSLLLTLLLTFMISAASAFAQ